MSYHNLNRGGPTCFANFTPVSRKANDLRQAVSGSELQVLAELLFDLRMVLLTIPTIRNLTHAFQHGTWDQDNFTTLTSSGTSHSIGRDPIRFASAASCSKGILA